MTRDVELMRLWKVEAESLNRDPQLCETKKEAVKAACELVRDGREKLFSVVEVVGVRLDDDEYGFLYGGDDIEGFCFNTSSDAPLKDYDSLNELEIAIINKTGYAPDEEFLKKLPKCFRSFSDCAAFTLEEGKLNIYPFKHDATAFIDEEEKTWEEDCLSTATELAYSELLTVHFCAENCVQKFYGECNLLELIEFSQGRYCNNFEVIFH